MKKLFAYILTSALLLLLPACHSTKYRDDLTSQELSDRVTVALDADGEYVIAANDALEDYFQTPAFVREHSVRFRSNRNNIDEFGIFHVSDSAKKEMQIILSSYLSDSLSANRSWYDSYIPQETPKLRDAEVRIFGDYVAYAILSKEDRTVFFDTLEAALKV